MADSFGLKIGLEGEKEFKKNTGRHQPVFKGAQLRNEANHFPV